jgi:hypothetical protein
MAKITTGKIGQVSFSKFGPMPTMEDRERAAGLYLRGNDPTSGRFPLGEIPKARTFRDDVFEDRAQNSIFDFPTTEGGPTLGQDFMFRQLSGTVSVADEGGNATVAELQAGLVNLYSFYSDQARYGDIVTLIDSSTGALVARFLVVLQDDGAPSEATVAFSSEGTTFYGLNITTSSIAALTDAFDQYSGIFDSSGTVPRDEDIIPDTANGDKSSFQISVSSPYDIDPETGALQLGTGVPVIYVKGGTYEVFPDISGTFSSDSTNSFRPPETGVQFVAVYAKFQINFTGSIGSRVPSSIGETAFEFYGNTENSFKEGGFFNANGSVYTHYSLIGVVALLRRGFRSWAYINQKIQGNITGLQGSFNSVSVGTQTDSGGTDVSDKTKSGMREVILCLNGKPYGTFILTGPLFEIT